MSRIGYIRVSTEHQETARQQEIMVHGTSGDSKTAGDHGRLSG